MGAVATLRAWAALLLLVVLGGPGHRPASLVTAAIDGGGDSSKGGNGNGGGSSAGAGASCPMGCVCSAAEVSCRNLDLEDAPVAELRAASAAGRDWSGITKL